MKKKLVLGVMVLIAIVTIVGTVVGANKLLPGQFSDIANYVVLNDSLIIDNNCFYRNELSVHADQLEELIGYTIEGDQVYSIKGLDKNEWICLRNAGDEIIYRSTNINPMTDLINLEISKLEIRNYSDIELITEYADTAVINELTEQIIDENLVTGDIMAEDVKFITFCLKDFPGLEYNCSYIIDENDNHFLYDFNTDCTWKLITNVFENK